MYQLENGFWVPDDTNYGTRFFDEDHNRPQAKACIMACEQKRVAIDGGAFLGTFSKRIAPRFQQIYAFEPIPAVFDCLTRNVAGNVEPYNVALHSKCGYMRTETDVKARPYSAQFQETTDIHAAGVVPSTTIDFYNFVNVDLIKLDVEGNELNALRGAANTITLWRPVILIEDKHDKEKLATAHLVELGYVKVFQKKHDYLFVYDKGTSYIKKIEAALAHAHD